MANNKSIKQEITYAERLCHELEKKIEELEKKLEENTKLKDSDQKKKAIAGELKEAQKLLQRHTDQLHHLKTHNSGPLRLIMALTLIIFVIWMIFVIQSNWGQSSVDVKLEGLF